MASSLAPLGAYAGGSADVMRIIYDHMINVTFKNGSELAYFISPHLDS